MKLLTLAILLAQAPAPASLNGLQTALRQMGSRLSEHKDTHGATAELTAAKHQMRDWIEARLTAVDLGVDPRAFAAALHGELRAAGLLCDDCESDNWGYVDDVRVDRAGGMLVVITAFGIECGYDESAYLYAWTGGQWRRVWEHERSTYTLKDYLPQSVHDVQVTTPDTDGSRLVMLLGSQTVCGGAFKNLYTRVWRLSATNQISPVLDATVFGNDGYPPIDGRLRRDEVLIKYTAGGRLDGDPHTAIRRWRVSGNTATAIDPIAVRPLDFVLEWVAAPWDESRTRSESPALQTAHVLLHRTDDAGDFPDATLRCSSGDDLWQVTTKLFEGQKTYYRVRWAMPYTFSMVAIGSTPFADCTIKDERGDAFPNVFNLVK